MQHRPLTEVKGIGDAVAAKLRTLGLQTVHDLVCYFPRRYDDYSHVTPIAQLRPGLITICATITSVAGRYVRRGMHITEAIASDETGSVKLVWFNQPYRLTATKRDVAYYISGEFGLKSQRLTIVSPSMELVSDFPLHTARIIPVYKETKGLKSAQLRKIIKQLLPEIRQMPETLPDWLIRQQRLIPYAVAVEAMHFPGDATTFEQARHRLAFEEVFQLTLAALLNKYELLQEKALAIPFDEALAKQFVAHLPFALTDDQRKAIWQVYLDMQKTQPMNRLVEGDVGSGKTVVAAMAALMAMRHGYQVALMAPTELLARQHADTIHHLLLPLGMSDAVCLLVGGLTAAQKRAAHARIQAGQAQFIIGTQALFQDKVAMHNLGLVIVDEQHRFGVEQRKKLQAKAGQMPHVLSMTATPIPRSLALTLYGELDISVIAAKPSGRRPVRTKIVSPNSRAQLYATIEAQLAAGRQMFVVCPLITTSDGLPAVSVEQAHKAMTAAFKQRRVGLLHGKLKAEQKDAVMQAFVAHELDILVSTTVIEVGVNVPNATVMVIENAERFGLAQIHQLRGRVGRSEAQGYCYLMLGDSAPPSRRLRALESSTDGFALAELDLEIRGPGAIYGTVQHGQLDLKIASLTDTKLIATARAAAQVCIDRGEDLLQYPALYTAVSALRTVTNLN